MQAKPPPWAEPGCRKRRKTLGFSRMRASSRPPDLPIMPLVQSAKCRGSRGRAPETQERTVSGDCLACGVLILPTWDEPNSFVRADRIRSIASQDTLKLRLGVAPNAVGPFLSRSCRTPACCTAGSGPTAEGRRVAWAGGCCSRSCPPHIRFPPGSGCRPGPVCRPQTGRSCRC